MIYSDYKQYVVETSIGLQDVDHLKNSEYFLELSNKYIKGEISLNQLDELITTYYKSKPDDESKQPDIASSNMFNILSCDNKFELSVKHFCDIHRKIFEGVFDHPGALRTYNIQKAEWVLGGDTVVYGDYRSLYDTISYDIQAEKDFDYDGFRNKVDVYNREMIQNENQRLLRRHFDVKHRDNLFYTMSVSQDGIITALYMDKEKARVVWYRTDNLIDSILKG